MLVVQKVELSGKLDEALLPSGGNIISAKSIGGKTVLFVETSVSDTVTPIESVLVKFGIYEAGEAIPDDADYLVTFEDEDHQVWHLYVIEVVHGRGTQKACPRFFD